ncbi:MAG TPA: 2-C-methyl-D-erythritol 2,4-cyclodiphosphate synthase [Dehalococcoidia bacterium]
MRIGIGYDLHRFQAPEGAPDGRPLVLGGLEIPGAPPLTGFSDADALLHAVIDALLGAAALGDIGRHFPPGDARYRGISSAVLLERTLALVRQAGFRVVNVDATVVAERPRLAPHLDRVRDRLAELLGLDPGRVNVKAKTNEGAGAVGRGEAIAVTAVALLDETSS